MVKNADETLGRIDILINSAGRNITKMAEDLDDES
jgi:NAD(P)-dependent dehydrogenase (short-subunit alcohol dehydrogenase family)